MKSYVIAAEGAGIKKFVRIDYDKGVSFVEDKTAASAYPFDLAHRALIPFSVLFKFNDLIFSLEDSE